MIGVAAVVDVGMVASGYRGGGGQRRRDDGTYVLRNHRHRYGAKPFL